MIVSFYSYKGGVGRTMGLANVAAELTRRHRSVLIVDFDIEAPGLPYYFPAKGEGQDRPGILDYLYESLEGTSLDFAEMLTPLGGSLQLITAGRSATYSERLLRLDWAALMQSAEGVQAVMDLRTSLANAADFVLVDSRPGLSEIAAISTVNLADIVVLIFALNRQGVEGTARLLESIVEPHAGEDRRHVHTILVPSRTDPSARVEHKRWLSFAADQFTRYHRVGRTGFRHEFRHYGPCAYGESIIVHRDRHHPLAKSYIRLAEDLIAIGEFYTDALRGPAPDPDAAQAIREAKVVIGSALKREDIPQLSRVEQVFDLVEALPIQNGLLRADIAKLLKVTGTQASYLVQAARALGLVKDAEKHRVVLTDLGVEIREKEGNERWMAKRQVVSNFRLVQEMQEIAEAVPEDEVHDRVTGLILARSDLAQTTASTRAQRLLRWLRWLEEEEPGAAHPKDGAQETVSDRLAETPTARPDDIATQEVPIESEERLPAKRKSMRGTQRVLAFHLAEGATEVPEIEIEALRSACQASGAYNRPNFTVNMRKDRRWFTEVRREGRLLGWNLTPEAKAVGVPP
ncbi:ParA family protein [Planctomycetota bacterium]